VSSERSCARRNSARAGEDGTSREVAQQRHASCSHNRRVRSGSSLNTLRTPLYFNDERDNVLSGNQQLCPTFR